MGKAPQRRAAVLMPVDPVVRARAIVADCLARSAGDGIAGDGTAQAAPPPRRPALRARWRLGDREVAVGFACIMFSAYIICYTLIPR
jgi:hypothetical protein